MIVRILAIVCCCVLSTAPAAAQENAVLWGPAAGYSFGVPLSIARDAGVINRYNMELTGTSADHQVWAGVQLFQPSWLHTHWGWSAALAMAMASGSFTSTLFESGEVFTTLSQFPPGIGYSQVEVSTLVGLLRLNAQMQYNAIDSWTIGVGPWLSYRWASHLVRQERVVHLEDGGGGIIPLSENEALPVVRAENSLESSPFRAGLALSLSRRIALQHNVDLMPSLQADIDAGSLIGDKLGIRAARIGVGLSVLFSGSKKTPVEYIRDTVYIAEPLVSVPVPPTAPALQSAIQLHSMQGAQKLSEVPIQKKSTYYKQSSELLPLVFFEDNSAAVPVRYTQLQQEEVEGFSRHTLVRLSPVQVYYHVLNILGVRMAENPMSAIVLTGSTVRGEPIALAQARAESVRNYLRDVWGIDEKRMAIREERGGNESRSVAISSTSSVLTEPVVIEWKLQNLAAPPVKLSHRVHAEAGVQSWRLLLTYRGREVGRYEGTTVQELDSLSLAFNISAGMNDSVLAPLFAVLVVDDKAGATTTATAAIPLVWNTLPHTSQASGSAVVDEKENMSTILFASDTEASSMVNHPLLQTLLFSVRADARITISSLVANSKENGEALLLRPDRLAEVILAALKKREMPIMEMHVQRQGEYAIPSLQGLPERTLFQSAVCVVVEQNGKQ